MKTFTHILIFVSIFTVLCMPLVTEAVLVPCGVTDDQVLLTNPTYGEPCTFTHFMFMINKIITFVIMDLALPIAAIMFAYAGFVLVTAPGDESRTKAKNIFLNTLIGLILAVGAWLIVKTFLSFAGYKDIGLFFS